MKWLSLLFSRWNEGNSLHATDAENKLQILNTSYWSSHHEAIVELGKKTMSMAQAQGLPTFFFHVNTFIGE